MTLVYQIGVVFWWALLIWALVRVLRGEPK